MILRSIVQNVVFFGGMTMGGVGLWWYSPSLSLGVVGFTLAAMAAMTMATNRGRRPPDNKQTEQ